MVFSHIFWHKLVGVASVSSGVSPGSLGCFVVRSPCALANILYFLSKSKLKLCTQTHLAGLAPSRLIFEVWPACLVMAISYEILPSSVYRNPFGGLGPSQTQLSWFGLTVYLIVCFLVRRLLLAVYFQIHIYICLLLKTQCGVDTPAPALGAWRAAIRFASCDG